MAARILVGDVRDRLRELPDRSVQCVVTSPPYYGLRSYGTPSQVWDGDSACAHEWQIKPVQGEKRGGNWAQGVNGRGEEQPGGVTAKRVVVLEQIDTGFCSKCDAWLGHLGLEPTLAMYLGHIVDIFRDLRRVLKDDGSLWLNVGDSYAVKNQKRSCSYAEKNGVNTGLNWRHPRTHQMHPIPTGFKQKDLMMVPARLAIALQDDGWWLRSDIIWSKPNPMPESVTDRPTSAHEHIFLLTKSRKYYYDQDAVRLPMAESSIARLSQDVDGQDGSSRANGGAKTNGTMKAVAHGLTGGPRLNPDRRESRGVEGKQRGHSRPHEGFNDRWDSMTKAEQQATGANLRNVWSIAAHAFPDAHFATFSPEIPRLCIKAGSRKGDTILDPFLGSGTTLLVADELGRDGIGIELNPEYAAMAERRIRGASPMFAKVEVA